MVGGLLSVPGYTSKGLPSVFITPSQLYYPLHLGYLPCYIGLSYTVVWNAAAGVRTHIIYYISHTRRCPYTRVYRIKESKCMFSRNTLLHHRGGIYKYPICQSPFNPKKPKSKIFKIFLVDGFFTVDKIYTGEIIAIMFGSPI